MRPYTEALSLDPNFGLALRVAHVSLATALENSRIGPASCYRIIDQCLDVGPVDGEGCVQMAAHLAVLGDDERAKRWLEHATHLNPPPPRGLESLGILMARRGKYVEARDLWLQGVGLDGHPDFFAHLARLAFNEGNLNEAWDKVLRGLRRMYERMVRSEEWVDDGQGLGLLLQYMVEHLESQKAPEEVIEALRDLSGLLVDPEDRVDLGLCLQRVGVDDLARVEIEAALSADAIDLGTRDKGVRALLVLDVPDFERRFARAADTANTSRNPARGMREMREFITRQPEFWPALFFLAMGLKRQEHADEALDSLQEVLQIRPGQVETLCEMGELFAARGNPKRALECVEEALLERSEDPRLHARRAEYLEKLDRKEEAREAFERAVELDRAEGPDDGEGRPEAEK